MNLFNRFCRDVCVWRETCPITKCPVEQFAKWLVVQLGGARDV